MTPEEAGLLIEDRLRASDSSSIDIVRRLRPTVHGASVAATLPVMLYQIAATLTTAERFVWIAWIWAIAILRLRRRH